MSNSLFPQIYVAIALLYQGILVQVVISEPHKYLLPYHNKHIIMTAEYKTIWMAST